MKKIRLKNRYHSKERSNEAIQDIRRIFPIDCFASARKDVSDGGSKSKAAFTTTCGFSCSQTKACHNTQLSTQNVMLNLFQHLMFKRFRNKFEMTFKCGFTLAEVLITLVIIGVIATITIPNLYSKYQKHVWATALKKQFTIISNVQQIINRELNTSADLGRNAILSLISIFEENTKSEQCKNNSYAEIIGCSTRPFSSMKTLNNNAITTSKMISQYYYRYDYTTFFKMKDGATIGIQTRVGQFGGYMWNLHGVSPIMYIVDVNGSALPNQLGRDIFIFVVKNNAVVPYSLNNTSDCNPNSTGDSCGAYLFKNGWKMDY